jgi:hypothetical protein
MKYLCENIVARRTYANNGGYESTYKNLLINSQTKVICQGFTGKQVIQKKLGIA